MADIISSLSQASLQSLKGLPGTDSNVSANAIASMGSSIDGIASDKASSGNASPSFVNELYQAIKSNIVGASASPQQTATSSQTSSPDFTNALSDVVRSVDTKTKDANQHILDLSMGKTDNLYETVFYIKEASLSLTYLTQLANSISSGFKELLRLDLNG